MKTVVAGLLMIALVAGGATYYLKYATAEPPAPFKTAPVKRGDILTTVGATGTIEPEEVVDVGAQVTGPILELGADPRGETDPAFKGKRIDYTTPVDKGTILVQIDPAVYQANYDQAKATLDRANADLGQLIAKRDQAEAEWKRAQILHEVKLPTSFGADQRHGMSAGEPLKAISDSDYDLTKSNYEVAKADVDVGQSTIVQSQAALDLAKTNSGYTTIRSPVKGTIIDRRVNIGQTVVANFNAASLFLIAEDLSRMQVWASVNEADIGRIKVGMPVQFSVAALPDQSFSGQVSQIRLNAQSTQNVVVYTVVITFDNSDMKVMPYLTADPIKFIVDKQTDVLTVPNAALAFEPRPEDIAPSAREEAQSSAGQNMKSVTPPSEPSPGSPATGAEKETTTPDQAKPTEADIGKTKTGEAKNGTAATAEAKAEAKAARRAKERESHGTLWVKDDEFVRPIAVQVGASDGLRTEVSGPDVTEGLEVIVGQVREEVAGNDTKNPFAPQFFRRGGGGGGRGGGAGGGGGQGGGGRGGGKG